MERKIDINTWKEKYAWVKETKRHKDIFIYRNEYELTKNKEIPNIKHIQKIIEILHTNIEKKKHEKHI